VLIALSGYGQERDRAETLNAGFRDHLTKPVSSEALVAALASALATTPVSGA